MVGAAHWPAAPAAGAVLSTASGRTSGDAILSAACRGVHSRLSVVVVATREASRGDSLPRPTCTAADTRQRFSSRPAPAGSVDGPPRAAPTGASSAAQRLAIGGHCQGHAVLGPAGPGQCGNGSAALSTATSNCSSWHCTASSSGGWRLYRTRAAAAGHHGASCMLIVIWHRGGLSTLDRSLKRLRTCIPRAAGCVYLQRCGSAANELEPEPGSASPCMHVHGPLD